MKEQGYDVGDLPEDPEELIREITAGGSAFDMGIARVQVTYLPERTPNYHVVHIS